MTGAKLNKIHTEFVFFKAFPDESTVGVVYSFPAGITGDGAELDKTPPKFCILKFFPDKTRLRSYYAGQGRKSPCLNVSAPKPEAAVLVGRYGSGIIIGREYKETERTCRSRGAPGARPTPLHYRDAPLPH